MVLLCKVFSLDDATHHPQYEIMTEYLGTKGLSKYDQFCFHRWLAMDLNGEGGWLCDYDTFPLNVQVEDGVTLPNAGKFTSFEAHVPSLLSGSPEEWRKLTQALLNESKRYIGEKKLSDMWVLSQLIERGVIDGSQALVWNGYPLSSPDTIVCRLLQDKKAIHFSHSQSHLAVQNGLLPNIPAGMHAQTRGTTSRQILKLWRSQCLDHNDGIKQ